MNVQIGLLGTGRRHHGEVPAALRTERGVLPP